ncbi:Zn-dependent protease (includes SpoIVFB) [Andreprevotia lacus DSM 23236]|jgi:Zn-dependent protease|uniref:Zn-dependent protease (Includes SpoIVFB) n=1 Tax=Andreprevotia lacus DSM 23236 TaxID=1121001 RepID=A0A1W1XLT6_9NEIS|nr:site-2 protease family protein [Andreprevotia lacus]SMC24835.1 Zn-dependent protease (includes SpoIVFB) [Andreprevotia lacus DSM 23236]
MGSTDISSIISNICIWAIPVLFAITVHEAAHGYVARHFGDDTAWKLGRISLNPLKHIDPIGTIALPLLFLVLPGSFMFGYAKPVPVRFSRLRNPKGDMFWVAIAGPLANFLMALFWGAMVWIAVHSGGFGLATALWQMAAAGVYINLSLMMLNLLPIPPLDGGRVLVSLLPHRQAELLSRIEPYGFFILIGLMIMKVLGVILWPMMLSGFTVIGAIFQLPIELLVPRF